MSDTFVGAELGRGAFAVAHLRRVLLIEDNPGDVQLLTQALTEVSAPVRLHAVQTVEEALAYLRQESPSAAGVAPDLILLDLNLPAVNGVVGLDLIRLTDDWREIPIIVLSSSTRPRDRDECRSRGANDYWVKPTDFTGYVSCAERLSAFLAALP